MKILIIGANGNVGRKLIPVLHTQGHQVKAMVRNKSQFDELASLGSEPVLGDLEGAFSHCLDHTEAVIFTAGSGGHTGADKTMLVDLLGAMKAVDSAVKKGVDRFVMVSAHGAKNPGQTIEKMRHYFVAKSEADKYLRASGLNYLILRPGRLTDEKASKKVYVQEEIEEKGETSRENLAWVIAKMVNHPKAHKKSYDIFDGDTPIENLLIQ